MKHHRITGLGESKDDRLLKQNYVWHTVFEKFDKLFHKTIHAFATRAFAKLRWIKPPKQHHIQTAGILLLSNWHNSKLEEKGISDKQPVRPCAIELQTTPGGERTGITLNERGTASSKKHPKAQLEKAKMHSGRQPLSENSFCPQASSLAVNPKWYDYSRCLSANFSTQNLHTFSGRTFCIIGITALKQNSILYHAVIGLLSQIIQHNFHITTQQNTRLWAAVKQ